MTFRFVSVSIVSLACVALAIALAILSLPGKQAQRPQLSFEQKVRNYLVSYPEVLNEAAEAYERRNNEQRAAQRLRTLAAFKRIVRDPRGLPVMGNPKGDVTVVEFFDYRCPYCKRSLDELVKLVQSDRNVRLVFKEFPILGPESVYAARVALASLAQGKYLDVHMALMSHRGEFDQKSVLNIVKGLGVNLERLREDMKKSRVQTAIAETRMLADRLVITGTPAMIIGDELVGGYADLATLKALVQRARNGCKTC